MGGERPDPKSGSCVLRGETRNTSSHEPRRELTLSLYSTTSFNHQRQPNLARYHPGAKRHDYSSLRLGHIRWRQVLPTLRQKRGHNRQGIACPPTAKPTAPAQPDTTPPIPSVSAAQWARAYCTSWEVPGGTHTPSGHSANLWIVPGPLPGDVRPRTFHRALPCTTSFTASARHVTTTPR